MPRPQAPRDGLTMTNHTFQKKIEGYDADADAVGDGSLRLPWAALGDVVERRTAKTRRGLDASFRDAVADAVGSARARSNRTDFLSDDRCGNQPLVQGGA